MPMYTYQCKKCGTRQEEYRSMKDCDLPPERPCVCAEPDWERVIGKTGVVRGPTWGVKGALK